MSLRSRNGKYEPLCHWCKTSLAGHPGVRLPLTSPEYSDWPALAAGTGVAVCGEQCSKRPAGAPVGRYKEGS